MYNKGVIHIVMIIIGLVIVGLIIGMFTISSKNENTNFNSNLSYKN